MKREARNFIFKTMLAATLCAAGSPAKALFDVDVEVDAKIEHALSPETRKAIEALPAKVRAEAIKAINALAGQVSTIVADLDARVLNIVEEALTGVECVGISILGEIPESLSPWSRWSFFPDQCEREAVIEGNDGPGPLASVRLKACRAYGALQPRHSPLQVSDKMSKLEWHAKRMLCRLRGTEGSTEALALRVDYGLRHRAWLTARSGCGSAATCFAGSRERLSKLIEQANAADTAGLAVRVQGVLEKYQHREGCGADVRCIGEHLVLLGEIESDMDRRREQRQKRADKLMAAAEADAKDARHYVDAAQKNAPKIKHLKTATKDASTAASLAKQAQDTADKALKMDPRLDKRRAAIGSQLAAIGKEINSAAATVKRTEEAHQRQLAEAAALERERRKRWELAAHDLPGRHRFMQF